MKSKKIDDRRLAMLKALISCDPRHTGKIAEAAGISRPFLINTVNGDRNVSGEKLDRILDVLNLTSYWGLKPDQVHVWSVCADIEPLVIAVNALVPYPTIWPLTKSLNDDDRKAYRGFFLICSRDPDIEDGTPVAPYIIIDRDPYRLGRGNQISVKPDEAKPITPDLFNDGSWTLNNNATLNSGNRLAEIDNAAQYGLKIDYVMSLIHHKPATWETVIRVATESGITPQDILNMLEKARTQT